jgi:hypothetical protein
MDLGVFVRFPGLRGGRRLEERLLGEESCAMTVHLLYTTSDNACRDEMQRLAFHTEVQHAPQLIHGQFRPGGDQP